MSQPAARPPWASHCNRCRKVEDWDVALAEDLLVDVVARMSFSALARMSDEGFDEAEHIVVKLLKKLGDGWAANKPSAFVMRSCQNARYELLRR